MTLAIETCSTTPLHLLATDTVFLCSLSVSTHLSINSNTKHVFEGSVTLSPTPPSIATSYIGYLQGHTLQDNGVGNWSIVVVSGVEVMFRWALNTFEH